MLIRRARLPGQDGLFDLALADGHVAAITPHGGSLDGLDQQGGLVLPGFVDLHTHLDKGHIWPRAPNPDGTFAGALATVAADRAAHWTADDIARRFEFGLRCAHAHGTVAIRTHLDSPPDQFRITWPLFAELRARWAGRIALQGVAIVGLAMLDDHAYARDLATCVRDHGGIMGGVIAPIERLDERIDGLLRLAMDFGLALDLHVDETLDAAAQSLPLLAARAAALGWRGPMTVGHCCSLSVQPPHEVARTLDAMAEAGMHVVSLPTCNMYLQDRAPGRTPRRRGVTLLHEMAARGIPVSLASDNCRDPFYAYGDHDLLDVFRQAVQIAHLDHPHGTWLDAVTRTPAATMGLACGEIVPGAQADLVLVRARTMNELLSRPWTDRTILRHGQVLDARVPDYRELEEDRSSDNK